jgi:hypothetical protein
MSTRVCEVSDMVCMHGCGVGCAKELQVVVARVEDAAQLRKRRARNIAHTIGSLADALALINEQEGYITTLEAKLAAQPSPQAPKAESEEAPKEPSQGLPLSAFPELREAIRKGLADGSLQVEGGINKETP